MQSVRSGSVVLVLSSPPARGPLPRSPGHFVSGNGRRSMVRGVHRHSRSFHRGWLARPKVAELCRCWWSPAMRLRGSARHPAVDHDVDGAHHRHRERDVGTCRPLGQREPSRRDAVTSAGAMCLGPSAQEHVRPADTGVPARLSPSAVTIEHQCTRACPWPRRRAARRQRACCRMRAQRLAAPEHEPPDYEAWRRSFGLFVQQARLTTDLRWRRVHLGAVRRLELPPRRGRFAV